MQTKAKCAMLTSLKTVLIRSKGRANLMLNLVVRKPDLANGMLPKMSPSWFDGSLSIAKKGDEVAAEAQVRPEGTLQAEADLGTGVKLEKKIRVIAKAQQEIGSQKGKSETPRARLGTGLIGIGQCPGHLSAAVGLSSSYVTGMTEILKRRGIGAEVKVVIGVGAGHALGQKTGTGKHENDEGVVMCSQSIVVLI